MREGTKEMEDAVTMQKGTSDILAEALNLQEHRAHMAKHADFVRSFAEYLGDHEHGNPDPEEVVQAAGLFLILRLAWNPNPPEHGARHETMASLQDGLRALGYRLDLDGTDFDMHTPSEVMVGLTPEEEASLNLSGFDEEGTYGLVDAAVWHGMVHHIVSRQAQFQGADQLRALHSSYRKAVISRVASGSFLLERNSLGDLTNIALQTITDLADLTPTADVLALSMHLREVFGVTDDATRIDNLLETPPAAMPGGQFAHAAATLAAIGGADPAACLMFLVSLAHGSQTGIPIADRIEALDTYMVDPESVASPSDEEDRGELEGAIEFMQAAMTLLGRIPPLDRMRTRTLTRLVAEDLHQTSDLEDVGEAEAMERLDRSLRFNADTLDDFLNYAEATEADDDAMFVRTAMDAADPSPAPNDDEKVLPRALLVETSEGIDVQSLVHRIDAFFVTQPDSFRAFAQGDVYWRLSSDGYNNYSGVLGALRTIAKMPGIDRASIAYRSNSGLGVVSIRGEGAPLHRSIAASFEG